MREFLMELDYLIKAGRLPHGDCGTFIGQPCNCFQSRVARLLASTEPPTEVAAG